MVFVETTATLRSKIGGLVTNMAENTNMKNVERKVKEALAEAIEKDEIGNTFRKLGIPENIITDFKKTTEVRERLNSELLKAAKEGELSRIKTILEKGADVNAKGNFGDTPLHHATHYAAANCNIEIVRFLIEKGADVNSETGLGDSPLAIAAESNNVELCKFLMEKGANVNIRKDLTEIDDTFGGVYVYYYSTPLHQAAAHGNMELCKLFIEKGADMNKEDRSYKTPLDVAKDDEIKALMKTVNEQRERETVLNYMTSEIERINAAMGKKREGGETEESEKEN